MKEVDLKIAAALEIVRREFVSNVDRLALERAILDAKNAYEQTKEAMKTSLRRYFKLIFALVLIYTIVIGHIVLQATYASNNRARIDHLERLVEHKTRGGSHD